jgi:electron transport complex protein RnfC
MLKFTPRRHLTGGLRVPAHKAESTGHPIRRGILSRHLVVSTRQQQGPASTPVVGVGQAVARGETLARGTGRTGTDVHAPTSGHVVAIEPRDVPLASSVASELSIVIETDGLDRRSHEPMPIAPAEAPAELAAQISSAGIVGLGGAVFPTGAKLSAELAAGCELLIVNGAECEPYISCDDMLMREAPEEILDGVDILRQMVRAPECIIAIERDKPQAIDAITAAAEKLGIEGLHVAELPSIYPAGGERQLVEVLAGVEVPSTEYPADIGFLCQNVGTAYAVHNYFRHGAPLTSRIITVTGSAVAEPRNVEAMIGTPIADLIAACGGYRGTPVRLIHGGSMMGYPLASDALAVTAATNCVIVATAADVRMDMTEWTCIRCGECSTVCPARLQPQELLIAARSSDPAALEDLALDECIECGCCDIVCPSQIRLTETLRAAKPLMRRHTRQRAFSAASDERFRWREQRREDSRRKEADRRTAMTSPLADETDRKRVIEAAVERARQGKAPTGADGG